MTYVTRLLTPETWADFAALVEASNGVWGGCWCMGFHPEGSAARRPTTGRPRSGTRATARSTRCWSTTATRRSGGASSARRPSLPHIKNSAAYEKDLGDLPTWRIGCIFTGSRHRGKGVARAAVTAALEEIRKAGGGVVEAYPEQVVDRKPQRGAYLHTGPETLYEDLGFVRDRQIAKWRWVMRREVGARG